MPKKSSKKNSSGRTATKLQSSSTRLSSRTNKQIDSLPVHARHIFKSAQSNALKQYSSPSKRRGGKSQSREQVAHKVAWSAVKKKYEKEGDRWVSRN